MPIIDTTSNVTYVSRYYSNVQTGILALNASYQLWEAAKQQSVVGQNFKTNLAALLSEFNTFTVQQYVPFVQQFASNVQLDLMSESAVKLLPTLKDYGKRMDALNVLHETITGSKLSSAIFHETLDNAGLLDKLITVAVWGLGIYFGGSLLMNMFGYGEYIPRVQLPRYAGGTRYKEP